MKTDNKSCNAEKKYEKPILRVIELAADEVLATACKTRSGAGGKLNLCFIQNCKNSIGS
jgi:hypothetical protein